MESPMFRGIIKYVAFFGVLVGIAIVTRVLEQVVENASPKGFKTNDGGQLVSLSPTNTDIPSSPVANTAQTQLKKTVDQSKTGEKKAVKASPPKTIVYAVTPTYARFLQKAELTRLSQTLKHVKDFHWIIVEDSHEKTPLVTRFLARSGLNYTHLNIRTPVELRPLKNKPRWTKARGVEQRNIAIKWLRDNVNINKTNAVVYFADDDNTYDIRLFEEMRNIKKIGVWPVAFTGAARYAGPLCKNGRVVGFYTNWRPTRTFPLDMAAFAINVKRLIVDKPKAHFDADAKPGDLENSFLEQVGTREDLEPRASNCSKVYVWHTRTETPIKNINGEKLLISKGKPSNPDVET
ncbi:galactosylgalactosylxylosylprotein 3-beta-glucuronosyltransferase 3-like isoform X4 [Stylophora pistillata]|uniref:galactosylgalactosylxylosylprotein 3-beta-glucuronosyltransferase 3-like isoform X4 n=1 Tax=Stylophora pistillata TaxID=50429 RepID=UPI000C0446C0|nr:galactosylgalactosylxylosylprotein 3-beta-glucuronosyltransferase 3-like isoform X4 [Stylophora pistillata]